MLTRTHKTVVKSSSQYLHLSNMNPCVSNTASIQPLHFYTVQKKKKREREREEEEEKEEEMKRKRREKKEEEEEDTHIWFVLELNRCSKILQKNQVHQITFCS